MGLLVSLFGNSRPQSIDMTREPGAIGRDVVSIVTSLVQQSGIFPDDNRFLLRVAFVETRYGQHPITFKNDYDGGIWQVDRRIFLATQDVINHPELAGSGGIYNGIQRAFGIDWAGLSWVDLRKPLMSVLAARIFFQLVAVSIPNAGNLTAQGELWKSSMYNNNDRMSVDLFVQVVSATELLGMINVAILYWWAYR